ncbi:MAG: ATP-dependent helicase [Actinobacteria bacterium]|nr:ATP-dependent helicase [Actinomycetota bacterium]
MSTLAPSPEQQEILDLGLRPIRVRAGAGTGKTTTVAMVIANLVATHGIEPEQMLGITFTNKAAAELAHRVSEFMPGVIDPSRQAEIHTYHGFAAQILSEFGALAGLDHQTRVITPTFARQLMSDTFHSRSYQHLDITHTGDLDKTRRLGDRLGDHLLGPEDLVAAAPAEIDETWAKRLEMAETLAVFAADKRRLRVVDYSDLVTLSTLLVRKHPELAAAIRDRYRVVVLDEYQDTNPAQRVLLHAIFDGGFPVIAVGDEDQTIYEWRGASAENFALFPMHFADHDGTPAEERGLRLNRRSAQGILDIANQVRKVANPEADELTAVDPAATAEVRTYWAGDALEEADWVARRFEALHEAGSKWSDMAVLFRKNKDFAVVVDAMARHEIPVEVANIGGLLSVPEVAELRAWLSILDSPEDSPALVQILLGSRFRLGLADLAPLTRWLSGFEPEPEDSDDPTPVTLIEAIELADEVEGLRPEAREALGRFLEIYREALVEGQGLTLVETLRLILDRTRAWHDIEALPPVPRLTARLNVYRLLDVAEDWSPLSGRPSVRAFLEYLDLMEEEPAEELDSARLSGEDAVTLVTVHRAKGLEWETVALPALARNNFPSSSSQFEDPVRFPEHVPVHLRIDEVLANLPADEDERMEFLRQRHHAQEWRVAYVAVTRAKKRLLASGAYWYGLPEPRSTPAEHSPLFEMIADSPVSVSDGHAEHKPRPELLRSPTRQSDPDPLFPAGWERAVRDAMEDAESIGSLAAELGLERPYRETLEDITDRLFAIDDIEAAPVRRDDSVSVTGLVTYAQCPKRFYWTAVDPLPRRHNPAARRGTEIHRRIELHQRGQPALEPIAEAVYDRAADEEDSAPEGMPEGGFAAYLDSRFAERRAALVEAPFSIELDTGLRVRGRIDAIYADDGVWEVVDFKSGRPGDDPSRIVQLQAYAVAADQVDFGLEPPERLEVSFAHLGGGLEVRSHLADETWLEEARRSLGELAQGIESGSWEPTPGEWCHGCDFVRFCGPGQAEVGG